MKKKLIATLVAGAVLSVGIVGLTACGGGEESSVPKGEEVTKEQWTAAFAASIAAENYTGNATTEIIVNMSGTDPQVGAVDLNMAQTIEQVVYFDGNAYSKSTEKVTYTNVPEAWKETYKDSEYEREIYTVKEGNVYYNASYNGNSATPQWSVYTSPSSDINMMSVLQQPFATEKNGTGAKLSALYDAFTYSDGVYSATLYANFGESKVDVSVKDGYVIGLSVEASSEEEYQGNKESYTEKTVYTFSNYGSTTVNASDAAKNAVTEYKASHS